MASTSKSIKSKKQFTHISSWVICAFYFSVIYFLLRWTSISKEIALYDAGISALCITGCCYLIYSTLHYYLPKNNQYWKLITLGIVLTFMSVIISVFILFGFFDASEILYVYKGLPFRIIINFLLLACIMIITIFWNIQEEYEDNKKRKEASERMLRDAELYNMRQQLQPHFLFNSLNSIIALIGSKPSEARKMTFQLSDFLRGTMRKDDKQFIPLSDELNHLKLYLEIEKVRFGHRLQTNFDIDESCLSSYVPSMIVQPLLENAIKYGLYNITGDVEINLRIYSNQNMLHIQIENPFEIDQFENKKGTGFGISSIQRRLFLLYGQSNLLQAKAKDSIFTATLRIPQYDKDYSN